MKAAALSPEFVSDLKQQVGQYADVEIHVRNAPDSAEWFTEDQFWALMDQLDWTKEGNDEAVVEPVVAALAAMPVANIYRFQDLLSEKLWLLDTQAHAEASVKDPDGYISADIFLYDRCCVVANGKDIYEKVLNDPKKWPKGLSFERLLDVASDAYERKTGSEFDYFSTTYNYESGSNEKGWE